MNTIVLSQSPSDFQPFQQGLSQRLLAFMVGVSVLQFFAYWLEGTSPQFCTCLCTVCVFSHKVWFRFVWCKLSAFILHLTCLLRAYSPASGMSWSAVDRWQVCLIPLSSCPCWQRYSVSSAERTGEGWENHWIFHPTWSEEVILQLTSSD